MKAVVLNHESRWQSEHPRLLTAQIRTVTRTTSGGLERVRAAADGGSWRGLGRGVQRRAMDKADEVRAEGGTATVSVGAGYVFLFLCEPEAAKERIQKAGSVPPRSVPRSTLAKMTYSRVSTLATLVRSRNRAADHAILGQIEPSDPLEEVTRSDKDALRAYCDRVKKAGAPHTDVRKASNELLQVLSRPEVTDDVVSCAFDMLDVAAVMES
jgi:hypothetical protein